MISVNSNTIQVTTLEASDVENMPNVQILDLRDNKIADLPKEVVALQVLVCSYYCY